MLPHTPSWPRYHWKWLAGLLLLLAVGGIVIGVLAWKRGSEGTAEHNPAATETDNEPKMLLSQYSLFVNSLAFSPDGRQLATAGTDMSRGPERRSEVRLWDVPGGREQRKCLDFLGVISSLAFSPDGKTLACSREVITLEAAGTIKRSPDVQLLHLDDATTSVFRLADRAVLAVAFSPQGDRLAVSCPDGSVPLYNPATREQELLLHSESGVRLTSNLAFSADGKTIASGGVKSFPAPKTRFQGLIQVWNAVAGKPLTTLHPPESRQESPQIKSLEFLPDGDRLVAACGRNIYFWNLKSGLIEATLNGHPNAIVALALSRDGRVLASADNYGTIKLWQVSNHSERATLQNLMPTPRSERQGMCLALAFAPDGQTLASSMILITPPVGQGAIKLWDVATAKEIALPR